MPLYILPLLFAHIAQGPIKISIDARQVPYGIVHTHEIVPASPGQLTLSLPKWLPGYHTPGGDVSGVLNLQFTADGKTLNWHRDDVEMYHFVVEVPPGATEVTADYDFGSQPGGDNDPFFARLDWNQNVLYPFGPRTDDIMVSADVTVPEGWHTATALLDGPASEQHIRFRTVSLTEFIDSPAISGVNFNRVQLGDTEGMDIVGDTPASTAVSPDLLAKFKNLIAEAHAQYGAQHYRHYDFLVSLSDNAGFAGLEHHESSEDGLSLNGLSAPDAGYRIGYLISHEYAHSWNGKYRRPKGIATPDYDTPMRDELLWVYEGLTEYLGEVIATRAGLFTPEQFRNDLARLAGMLQHRAGRSWRSVEDTATGTQIHSDGQAWGETFRGGGDYYFESFLIWLEVDSIIRKRTNGAKSLDDFCRLFHGGKSGPPEVKPYGFNDVVKTLNEVTPYDWAALLHSRFQTVQPQLSLAGIENEGWRLVYDSTPPPPARDWSRGAAKPDNDAYLTIGAHIAADGNVTDVALAMPAGVAGLRPGMKVTKVAGKPYSDANMLAALGSKAPFDVEVDFGGPKTLHIDYSDGLKYPHLVRDDSKPDLMSQLTAAKAHQ